MQEVQEYKGDPDLVNVMMLDESAEKAPKVLKIKTFKQFIQALNRKFLIDEKVLIFIDIDGILATAREFCLEKELANKIKRLIKEQFRNFLKGQDNYEKLIQILSELSPDVVKFLCEKIKKDVEGRKKKNNFEELTQEQHDEICLEVISKELAFGVAMEISPACELKFPIEPGDVLEKNTLARDLYDLLQKNQEMHVFFLTSRPLRAAQNVEYILKELEKSSELMKNELFELIKKRALEFKLESALTQIQFEHELHIVADICIASGRNDKGPVIHEILKKFNLSKVAFIDDKDKYTQEVFDSLGEYCRAGLLVAQQEIPTEKEIAQRITLNEETYSQALCAMIDGVSEYSLCSLETPNLPSARKLALCAFAMLGITDSKSQEKSRGLEDMECGKSIIAKMLQTHVLQQQQQEPQQQRQQAGLVSLFFEEERGASVGQKRKIGDDLRVGASRSVDASSGPSQ
jgi:hypothetical protein